MASGSTRCVRRISFNSDSLIIARFSIAARYFDRRRAADRPVGMRRDRGLVDDALAALVVDAVVVAPLLREDVMDVDGQLTYWTLSSALSSIQSRPRASSSG